MRFVGLILAAVCALVCSGSVRGGTDPPDGNKLINATLLVDHTTAEPGQKIFLGVHLAMEEGWHTYWRTSGDSGLPVSVGFGEVDSVSFGEILWQAPEWYLGAGNVLDYVYHGETVLLVPATISPDAEPGTAIEITCDVSWLVCKDVCLPGSATLTRTIQIGETGKAGADGHTIRRWERELPTPIGTGTVDVRLGWRGALLEVYCPDADQVTVFLDHSEETAPLGRPGLRSVSGDTVRIPFDPAPDQHLTVTGVITVDKGRERGSYEFAIPGPVTK